MTVNLVLVGLLALAALTLVLYQASRLREASARARGLEGQIEEVRRGVRELRGLKRNQEFIGTLLQRLPAFAARLYGGDSVRNIPRILIDMVERVFEPEAVIVLVRRKSSGVNDERQGQLIVATTSAGAERLTGSVVSIDRGELGVVARQRQTMNRRDFERSPDLHRGSSSDELKDFRCDLASPLVVGDRLLGIVALSLPERQRLDDKKALHLLTQIAALALDHLATLSKMRSVADLDPLTGVFNKGVLTYRMGELSFRALEEDSSLAVFLFDLDNFKNYNDVNGHPAGDTLLKKLARLVEKDTRLDDTFGRYGGEEFLLLMPGRTAAEAAVVAEGIRRKIEGFDFEHGDKQPLGRVTISGGVAAMPEDAQSSTDLLSEADAALYRAKRAGRNRILRAGTAVETVAPQPAPDLIPEPATGEGDQLREVRGIGPAFEERLREQGINSYEQIAAMTWREIQDLAETIGTTPERVIRERWIEQARGLSDGVEES